jgi:ATP-binding cassette subfamily F protein uup
VTHDRYLLDQVSTILLALDGNGHAGYYADYLQWERDYAARTTTTAKPAAAPSAPKPAQTGLNAQERRELGQMEARIEAAETAHAALEAKMHSPEVASDPARLQETWTAVEASKVDIARLYERWDELERKRSGST